MSTDSTPTSPLDTPIYGMTVAEVMYVMYLVHIRSSSVGGAAIPYAEINHDDASFCLLVPGEGVARYATAQEVLDRLETMTPRNELQRRIERLEKELAEARQQLGDHDVP